MHDSFHVHDIEKNAKEMMGIAQPPMVCHGCGKVLATITNGHNFWMNVGIGVPGSPDLAAFGCDSGQHWACSIECLKNIGPACFLEHVVPTIQAAHALLEQRRLAFEESIKKVVDNGNSTNQV
jgi:hypothetical protein